MPEASLAAKPFLKWAGGKTQLIPELARFLPERPDGTYFEPFMGSAALFFYLRRERGWRKAALSDTNAELVSTFLAVRDSPQALLEALLEHHHMHNVVYRDSEDKRREYFEAVRSLDRRPDWMPEVPADAQARVLKAARFIYLNRTCFNGLWRVNRKGQFNVPVGRYSNPAIHNPSLILEASAALQGVDMTCTPYPHVLGTSAAGDTIYFDPPYVPLSVTSSFAAYSRDEFGTAEHKKLAVLSTLLALGGRRVLLSNSDTPFTRSPLDFSSDREIEDLLQELEAEGTSPQSLREAYRDFWNVETVRANRRINSVAESRGDITEIVVHNKADQEL
ncbi:modification methylase DpnIIA [Deinococcus carri]|uniref:Site-specific DNA-methyltransferase (adenine-specific) n=2 Tax=Deinococcus carri TaxID=1211323 RepID=A0ABP9W8V3_9DEIO